METLNFLEEPKPVEKIRKQPKMKLKQLLKDVPEKVQKKVKKMKKRDKKDPTVSHFKK